MYLELEQIAGLRKHAPTFAQSLRKRGVDLDHIELNRLTWADLNALEKDARHHAKNLPEILTDAITEERGQEIENAFDAATAVLAGLVEEKDYRTARGDRAPHTGVDLSKRPVYEDASCPAIDGGIDERDIAWDLKPESRMRTFAQAQSGDDYRGLKPGALLRAMAVGASNDVERRALAEGSDSAGGFTVPSTVSADLIDAMRASSVCITAGARTVPLDSNKHAIAKLLTDPVPAWRLENAAVNESDPTFGQALFEPKSLAVMVRVSRELLDDSLNIATSLPNVLTAALAKELDRVALLGSGSGAEPRGIVNTSGISTEAFNASLTGYAPLLRARTALLTVNAGEPTAYIAHPRDEGAVSAFVDSVGQPLNVPARIGNIPMLTSTQIPIDGGVGEDESTIIAGDFTRLLIGMRQEIRIEILKERYADSMQYAFLAHLRADVAVEHAAAFHTITGVTD